MCVSKYAVTGGVLVRFILKDDGSVVPSTPLDFISTTDFFCNEYEKSIANCIALPVTRVEVNWSSTRGYPAVKFEDSLPVELFCIKQHKVTPSTERKELRDRMPPDAILDRWPAPSFGSF
jgi:hypothetical protein